MNLDSCKCPGPSGFETLTFSCTEIRPLPELQQLCLFYTNTLSWQSSRRPPLLGTHAPLSIIQLLWKGSFLSGHIACPKEWPWPSSRMSLQIYFSLQRTIYEASLLQQRSLISRNRSLRGQPSGNRPLGEKETIWLVLVQFQLLPSYMTWEASHWAPVSSSLKQSSQTRSPLTCSPILNSIISLIIPMRERRKHDYQISKKSINLWLALAYFSYLHVFCVLWQLAKGSTKL